MRVEWLEYEGRTLGRATEYLSARKNFEHKQRKSKHMEADLSTLAGINGKFKVKSVPKINKFGLKNVQMHARVLRP